MRNRFPIWKQIITYITLIVLSGIFSIPFFWLVTTSFKTDQNISLWPPQIIPKPFTFQHYKAAVGTIPFGLYLVNTLVICALAVVGTVISSSLVAYGLSRIKWKGRDALFMIVLSTMMLPYQVVMVPLFAVYTKLGWVDTYLPLTVPAFLGNAFFIFLLRQFFMTVPHDLTEAAKLDGCNEFQVFRKVIVPLAKPALATVGLFTFINTWNDFLGPLIYLFDESHYTLSLGLQMFLGQYGNYFGRLMAASTLVVLPIIILFFFTQKTFIQGITMSGIKG
ncbi:MAG: carbohydrate ABC transporter permease [Armatimonadota bacterium]